MFSVKNTTFLLALALATPLLGAAPLADASQAPRLFTVSAYYSPLPGQSVYMRGSYEADVVLNGRGTNGASGSGVFSGMLAAPKKYAFGTKIWLKGLGLGTVQDRGGAIVEAGKRGHAHDRVDVWMGEGEIGLRRALTWGIRTVEGEVVTPELEKAWGPDSKRLAAIDVSAQKALKNVRVQGALAKAGKAAKASVAKPAPGKDPLLAAAEGIFGAEPAAVSKASSASSILALRQSLADLGYLPEAGAGKWDAALTGALAKFQADKSLVPSVSHKLAGTYGPKTRAALAAAHGEFSERARKYAGLSAEISSLKARREAALAKASAKARAEALSIGKVRPGAVGANVRDLQNLLRDLGHFGGRDTAIFGDATREALAEYQLARGLVRGKGDAAAGLVGPRTLGALAEDAAALARRGETSFLSEISGKEKELAAFHPREAAAALRGPLAMVSAPAKKG